MRKGISLIVLVITIVVIIILAGTAIASMNNNNPINSAKKAKFLSDIDTFKSELIVYKVERTSNLLLKYKTDLLNANESSLYENGALVQDKTIFDVIPSMKDSEYIGVLEVRAGELIYVGNDEDQIEWCKGIIEVDRDTSGVDRIAPNIPQIVVPQYSNSFVISNIKITLTDNAGGSGIDKNKSKYIIDKNIENYSENNDIWSVATDLSSDNFIDDVATVQTEINGDGEYYIHVLAVDNAGNKKKGISSKIIVDTVVPNEPSIVIPSTSTTNNVDAIITLIDNDGGSGIDIPRCKYIYSTVSSPYGDTDAIWNSADIFVRTPQTITVTSSTNGIYYLHILTVDKAGNRREVLSSGVTTNSDIPIAPIITGNVSSNVWTNQNVTLTVNPVTSPDVTNYEYSINGEAWQTYNATTRIIISNEGTYTVKARAVNNIGTVGAESTGYIVKIDKTAPADPTISSTPTTITRNVTVTITYPNDAFIRQYSTNGTTWVTYNSAVIISNNNTKVYARSIDEAGNQSQQVYKNITNIDDIGPMFEFKTTSGGFIITASDVLSSVDLATLQYAWSTSFTDIPTSGWTSFTNGSIIHGTSTLWVRGYDSLGNYNIQNSKNGI